MEAAGAAASAGANQWNQSFRVAQEPTKKAPPTEIKGSGVDEAEQQPEPSIMDVLEARDDFKRFFKKIDFGRVSDTEALLIRLMAGAGFVARTDADGVEKSEMLQREAMEIIKKELTGNRAHFNINGPIGPDGDTLLKWGTRFGLYLLCEFLLMQEGMKLDTRNTKDLRAPNANIAFDGSRELFALFHRYGADIFCTDKHNQSLVMKAAAGCNTEVVKFILNETIKPGKLEEVLSEESKDSWTVMSYAAKSGSTGVLNALFEIPGKEDRMGQALEHRDKKGHTPLAIAAGNGKTEAVEAIAQFLNTHAKGKIDAMIDELDDFGNPPIGEAIAFGHYETVKMLCKYGANPLIANKYDIDRDAKTPLQTAQRLKDLEEKILASVDKEIKGDPAKSRLDCVKRNLHAEITRIRQDPHAQSQDNSVYRAKVVAIARGEYSKILDFLSPFLNKAAPSVKI